MWKAVKAQMSEQEQHQELPENNDDEGFDFTHVNSVARIALYEQLVQARRVSLKSSPLPPANSSKAWQRTYTSNRRRQVAPFPIRYSRGSENFIHARFQEATVSILDHGCTIRLRIRAGIACKRPRATARIHLRHRAHEKLHPRRGVGPPHREGIP